MEPDAVPQPQPVAPRVISGGGIGDGPIDGVVNLYVIDDLTRMPISNATVRVGTVDGVTDSTGLYIANVSGPQTIVAKANGYRSDVWIGVNGANVTMNLEKANAPSPSTGTLTGSITNFASLTVAAGHTKIAVASYSSNDTLGDEANEIPQPNDQNVCVGTAACNFTLTSRTGKVALVAAIFDRDLKGTPNDFTDDTQVFLAWAVKGGLTITNGTQTVGLDLVPAAMTQNVTVNFGSPPSGLGTVGALVGIDSADGTLNLVPMFPTPTATTFNAPKPEALASGATYRLTGIASNGQTNPTQSIVLRRGLTGSSLAAGTWLTAPSGTPTRTGGSWTAASGSTVTSLEYKQGATKILNVTVFDASTSVTLPDLVQSQMPTGSVTVELNGIGAPGLDVNNFSLDADRDKLQMVGGVTVAL